MTFLSKRIANRLLLFFQKKETLLVFLVADMAQICLIFRSFDTFARFNLSICTN